MNKEGYWGIDVDRGACAASMTLQGGSIFLLRAEAGEVSVALFTQTPMPKGKSLSLDVDGRMIKLPATLLDKRTTVFLDGALDAPSLASLRIGRTLRVLLDDQTVATMTLEGTGFAGAVDGVVACSKGEPGWWGKGVSRDGEAAPADLVYNKEDVWTLIPADKPGGCVAQAEVGEGGRFLQIIRHNDDVTVAVWSSGPALRRGRKGVLSVDGVSFDFVPAYDGKTYMVLDGTLAGEPLQALRASKGVEVSIDGKVLVNANLEGTGFPLILDELAACARGETGWWTPNATVGTSQ